MTPSTASWRVPARSLVFLSALCASAPGHAADLGRVEIVTASGVHAFDVEVARSAEELTHGLMGRRFLPQGRGMLFEFAAEQRIAMWMKDTFIPLDIIFISADGVVTTIKQNARPMSQEIISSDAPAAAVLELNAGVAQRISAAPGNRVRRMRHE